MGELLCLEVEYPGGLGAPWLDRALDVLVANAWAPLKEQCADVPGELRWRPYNRAGWHAILDHEHRALFLREHDGDDAIEAQVWNNQRDTAAMLYVPTTRTAPDDPRLRSHLAAMLAALPPGAHGSIFSTVATENVRTEAPRPLHRALWLAALPPAAYQRWITRELLLAAPGAVVNESVDGTIWIQVLDAPHVPAASALDALQTYVATRRTA